MMTKLDFIHAKMPCLRVALSLLLLIPACPLLLATVGAQVSFTGTAASRTFGAQAIGPQTVVQTLSFSISANTTVGSIAVLTLGAANLDFTNAAASTCSSQSYAQATQCTVAVKFAPAAVGLRMGAVVFYPQAGNTGAALASVPIYGTGTGPQIGFGPGTATAIDPKVNGCFLLEPVAVAFDGAGDLFIAEMYGVVKLPAGGGTATAIYPTVNGEGLDYPSGLAVDGAGNLFIADFEHNRVVEVPTGAGAAIAIDPTVKGKSLDGPFGLAVDAVGNLYIADALNWRVVEVPVAGGAAIAINPYVNGASLESPQGVAVDGAGDLFIADTMGKRVVELPVGGGAPIVIDPTVNGKSLWYTYGVGVDASGNLFIADTDRGRVVEMPAGGGPPISIDPLVNGKGLGGPTSVVVDSAGDVFIVDTFNNRLVELQRSQPPALSYPYPTNVGTADIFDSLQTVQIMNIGNEPLTLTALNYPPDFSSASGDASECTGTTTLIVGGECDVLVEFTPQHSGLLTENVTLTDNTLNVSGALQSMMAGGNGVILATLTSPASGASLAGTSITFSWTAVTGASGYKLWLGSTGLGSNNLYNSGAKTVTCVTVKALPVNGETIYARLFTNFNGTLEYTDLTYSAAAASVIASPASGSTLAGAGVTFSWPSRSGATSYTLLLGSTGAGSYNLWDSGATTATSIANSAMPVNGQTIYARLATNFNGTLAYSDSTYIAAKLAPAAMVAPLQGSTLAGASATFTWTAASGATGYQLFLGSTGPGSYNLYYSSSQTVTSLTVAGLPNNGETIFLRLYTKFNASSIYTDWTYTSATLALATMTTPAQGSTLAGSSVTFTWTPGTTVTNYQLLVGTTGSGSSGIYNSGSIIATSAIVSKLPMTGVTVYARLLSKSGGAWKFNDYTYTAK
jgi:sugar lactone lactonase YvrE